MGELAQEFLERGFVGPLDLLDHNEIKRALDYYRHATPSGNERFKTHLFSPEIRQAVLHPKLIQYARQLLQCDDILVWSSDFNVKEPFSETFYSPHQDSTYSGLEPADQVLTAWIALTASTPLNGCLRFWSGSHKGGQVEHYEAANSNNQLSRGQYCEIPQTLDDAVSMVLEPGQVSFHSFFTIHQSGSNSTDRQRIGLAVRFMTANVRQNGATKEYATLASGSHQDHFDLEPILSEHPTDRDVAQGRAVQREAVRRESANYFETCQTQNTYKT